MYITLLQTPDRDGFQGQVALNTAIKSTALGKFPSKILEAILKKTKQGMWEHIQKYLMNHSRSATSGSSS